jgi:tetratricopeptide (TPR) repeat protein
MQKIQSILSAVARRLYWTRLFACLSRTVVLAAALACLLVLVDRLTAVTLAFGTMVLVLAVSSCLVAFIWSLRRRPDRMSLAILTDQRLELNERLSTALQCHGLPDPFARAAVEDGVAVASASRTSLLVRQKFPIEAPHRSWIGPFLIVLAVGLAFLPERDLFARDGGGLSPEEERRLQEITFEIEEDLEPIRDVISELGLETDPEPGPGEADDLQPPRELSAQDRARENMRQVSNMRDQMQEFLDGGRVQSLEHLRDQLRQTRTSPDGPASEVMQSMRRGDFEKAAEDVAELARKMENGELSEAERQEAAKQLEDFAKQLEDLAAKQDEALRNALENSGLDPNAAASAEALEEALKKASDLTEEQKQQLRDLAQQSRSSQQSLQRMSQNCSRMGQGLGENNPGMCKAGAAGMTGEIGNLAQLEGDMKKAMAAMNELDRMAGRAGACLGDGSRLMSHGELGPEDWQPTGSNDGFGRGMGRNGGTGAGGIARKQETRVGMKQVSQRTFLEDGPMVGIEYVDGRPISGESRVQEAEILKTIREGYEEGVIEMNVPRQYEAYIKRYFGQTRTWFEVEESDDAPDAAPPASSESTD